MSRPKAVLYTRVSTDEQAEHGTSLAGQLEACQRVAAQHGADVVAHYPDAGVSGAHYATRAGLQMALADLETGKANMLIVYDVTRLSRDVEYLSAIVKRVRAAGARLVFNSGQFEDTPEGEMLLGVNGVMSQYERSKFRERSMNGKLRRLGEGKQPARGMRPYGYFIITREDVYAGRHTAGTEGTYIIDETEAPWARAIFGRYAAGASLREVARWLQEQGVRPPSHAPDRRAKYSTPPRDLWHAATIQGILKNSAYIGKATFGKRRHLTDESRIGKEHKSGAARTYKRKDYCQRVSSDKWQYVNAEVPALVDEATWNACQDRLASNQNTRSGNPETRYLFTGQLRCPICGRGLYGARRKRENQIDYVAYHCRDYAKSARADETICNPAHYNEKLLLAALQCGVSQCPALLDAALTAHERKQQAHDYTGEIARLHADVTALENKERSAVEGELAALSAGRNAAIYRKVLTEIDEERTAITARIADLEKRQQDRPKENPKAKAEVIAEALTKLEAVLAADEITVAEKNALLHQVVDIIVPHEDRIEVTLKARKPGGTVVRIVTRLS